MVSVVNLHWMTLLGPATSCFDALFWATCLNMSKQVSFTLTDSYNVALPMACMVLVPLQDKGTGCYGLLYQDIESSKIWK